MDAAFQLKTVDWEWTGESDEESLHEGFGIGFSRDGLLPTADALALVECLATLGCEQLHIRGGPIFYRNDWEQLARAARNRNIALHLVSNGYGIKDAATSVGQCFHQVSITLEGPEAVHDRVRQRPGSFVRALEALESLRNASIPSKVISTVSNLNIAHLDELKRIVEEAGAQEWVWRTTLGSGAVRRDGYANYTITPWDIPFLISSIVKYQQSGNVRVRAGCDIGYFEKESEIRQVPWGGCTAGFFSLGIQWNGDVKGCLCLPDEYVEGNVLQMPLDEIWHHPDTFAYNRKFDPEAMTGYCRVCPHSFVCGCGCIGAAVASTGSRFDTLYCHQRVTKEPEFLQEHSSDSVLTFVDFSSDS